MKPKNDRSQPDPRSAAAPAPRKRFRIETLEERIAPKKGGKGTNNCGVSPSDSGGGGTSSVY
jgi:hypothetical protein